MDTETKERLLYETTLRQLERMRSMQYAYHAKFFHWMLVCFVLFLILLLLPGHVGFYLLPFYVVTVALQASFYLHFCDFARVHSTHLEEKINGLLGKNVLLGSSLEELYFYPVGPGRIGGLLPGHPGRFFNCYTLHWIVLWTIAFLGGLFFVRAVSSPPFFLVYATAALVWAGAHLAYMTWYFGKGQDLQAVSEHLRKHLHQPYPG
jgi:hypothetical protein